VQKRGGQVEYIEFEGEGHGFRKAENLKQSLESEIGFYERVFGIKV
jgi:dipeptidyl aminopeptidase/acylaminoacyl peptidase